MIGEQDRKFTVEQFQDVFFANVEDQDVLEELFRQFVINYNAREQGQILSFLAGVIHRFKEDIKLK